MREPNLKRIQITDVNFWKNVTVFEPSTLYGCSIDDDCFIGPFVEIQRNASAGKQTRVQSHVFICELVTIGEDCFISRGAEFINNLFTYGKPSGEGIS